MAEPFIGEIRLFTCNFAPKGWAPCNGQLLSIAQNTALFSLLGVTYGGDGKTNFALPNLQGRTPVNPGNGVGYGEMGGEETHILTTAELPAHTHQAIGGSDGTTGTPLNNAWGTQGEAYSPTANTAMAPNALGTAGENQGHPNMQPFGVVQYCIALQGIWPPRN